MFAQVSDDECAFGIKQPFTAHASLRGDKTSTPRIARLFNFLQEMSNDLRHAKVRHPRHLRTRTSNNEAGSTFHGYNFCYRLTGCGLPSHNRSSLIANAIYPGLACASSVGSSFTYLAGCVVIIITDLITADLPVGGTGN